MLKTAHWIYPVAIAKESMHTTELYFEAHITIEPLPGDWLPILGEIGKHYGFRPASFLQKKGGKITPDDFMTGRGKDYEKLLLNTLDCVNKLEYYGFKVNRYKIENTLLDVRL